MRQPTFLFTYGTLQDPQIQLQLFQRKLHGHEDLLMGHCESPIKLEGKYPVIHRSPDPNDSIKGVVYELLPHELQQADSYEGPAYKRLEVSLASGKKAWVYTGRLD